MTNRNMVLAACAVCFLIWAVDGIYSWWREEEPNLPGWYWLWVLGHAALALTL